MNDTHEFVKLRAYWFRVFGGQYPNQIGKWLFSCPGLFGVLEQSVRPCVVDDFGNLVGV